MEKPKAHDSLVLRFKLTVDAKMVSEFETLQEADANARMLSVMRYKDKYIYLVDKSTDTVQAFYSNGTMFHPEVQ